MKLRMISLFFVVLCAVSVSVVMGQTKISGTERCTAPNPNYTVEVGDRAAHAFMLTQNKCEWTKPMVVEGVESKEGLDTSSAERSGNTVHFNGWHVSTMANGEKTFVRFRGTFMIKDGKPADSKGTWMFTGGTGKFKGLSGKGTFKGTPQADGTEKVEVEGEYALLPKK